MKRSKATFVFLLKLLISVGLLAFLITRIDAEGFVRTLATADFSYIGLAMVIYLMTQAISAVRWAVLTRPLGIRTSFKDLVVYYFIGMFFNLFAPSTVGGDVSRVYYLAKGEANDRQKRASVSTAHAAVSVLMDRAIGMVVLVWLGAAGLFLFPDYAIPATVRSVTFLLALALLIFVLLVPVLRLLPAAHPLVAKLSLILNSYRNGWRVIPQAMMLSLIVHLIQAWNHVIMGLALHLSLPLSFCIIIYPLVGTFAALPLSFNGLGLREGGYIFLLAAVGVGSEKGIAFGLLLFLIVALDSMIGGILFLIRKGPKASTAATEAEI